MSFNSLITWVKSFTTDSKVVQRKKIVKNTPYTKAVQPVLLSMSHDKKDFKKVAHAILNEFYNKTGVVPAKDVVLENVIGEIDLNILDYTLTDDELKLRNQSIEKASLENLNSLVSKDNNFVKKTMEFRSHIQEIINADYGDISEVEKQRRMNIRIQQYKESIREEALLLCTQAIYLTTGRVLRDKQLEAALAMQKGYLVDMKTGEGKTLAVIAATYLNALDGRGAFVTSANGYLAERDAIEAAKILGVMGITVGYANPEVKDKDVLQAAFGADVTYSTIDKFVFTQLEDESTLSKENIINSRGLTYMINDECDHTYLEKAVVPFINSGSNTDIDVDRIALAMANQVLSEVIPFSSTEELGELLTNIDKKKILIPLKRYESEADFNEELTTHGVFNRCLAFNENGNFFLSEGIYPLLAEKWTEIWDKYIYNNLGANYAASPFGSRKVFVEWRNDLAGRSLKGLDAKVDVDVVSGEYGLMNYRQQEFLQKFQTEKRPLEFYLSQLEDYKIYLNDADYNKRLEELKQNPTTDAIVELSLERIRLYHKKLEYDFDRMTFYTGNAAKAWYQFIKNEDYIVTAPPDGQNKVVLIDKSTGRIPFDETTKEGLKKKPSQRIADGIHQAIEAKEKVKITTKPTRALGRYTISGYIATAKGMVTGITGTALENATELSELYGFSSYGVDKYKTSPVSKKYVLYKNLEDKRKALIKTAVEAAKKGQPVLLTALNIEDAETLYEMINEELAGIDTIKLQKVSALGSVTNASSSLVTKADESRVIAHAGSKGTITVSTHMAGRGTDIKLGGVFEERKKEEIFKLRAEKFRQLTDFPQGRINNFLNAYSSGNIFNMEKVYGDMIKRFNSIEIDESIFNDLEAKLKKEADEIREVGGLLVLADGMPENLRVQHQREGRTARCGDPGDIKWFVSLDDPVLANNLSVKQIAKLNNSFGDRDSITFFDQTPNEVTKVDKKVNGLINNAININESKHTKTRIEIQKTSKMYANIHRGYAEGYNNLLVNDNPTQLFIDNIKKTIEEDVEECYKTADGFDGLRQKYLGLLVTNDAFPEEVMSNITPDVLKNLLVERATWFVESASVVNPNFLQETKESILKKESEKWADFLEDMDSLGARIMLSQEREKDYSIALRELWDDKNKETRIECVREILTQSVVSCSKALSQTGDYLEIPESKTVQK